MRKIRVNPIYRNEMKLLSRTIRFPILIFLYNAFLTFVALLVFYLSFGMVNEVSYEGVVTVYWAITAIEFIMIAFFVPSSCAGSISGEREKQTLELLLCTKTKPIQIILGKLTSSISSVLILFITSIPITAIVFSIGGVYIRDLLKMILLALITAIYFGSFSIFFSTKVRKTIAATVLSYGSILVTTLGSYLLILIAYAIKAFQISMASNSYQTPNIGGFVLILLLNPVFTVISALNGRNGNWLNGMILDMGKTNQFISNHWFFISIVVQMAIAALMLWLAAKNLNPLKKKQKKLKRKHKQR